MMDNKGFDPHTIQEYKNKFKAAGRPYLMDENDTLSDEYTHFYFVGLHADQEVVYDTVMYTLRLQHESELFEIAEQRAAEHFPEYKKIIFQQENPPDSPVMEPMDEEIGLFIAEVIMELEEEEFIKVQEHVDLDIHTDFGIALDVGILAEKIGDVEIKKFIADFNGDTLKLDENLYSFQTSDNEQ